MSALRQQRPLGLSATQIGYPSFRVSAGRTHFEADQSQSRDGKAPQFVPLLSLRRCRFRGLQNANPHPACGEKDRGTGLGEPSDAAKTLMSVKKRLRTVEARA